VVIAVVAAAVHTYKIVPLPGVTIRPIQFLVTKMSS
jgi:hypothetical protein